MSRSRIGLGRREARRRASLAKLRASPAVGGPAGPSADSRSGERAPRVKFSSPKLSQSPSSGSPGGGGGGGKRRGAPPPVPFPVSRPRPGRAVPPASPPPSP